MKKPTIVCVDEEVLILESLIEQLQKLFHHKYNYEISDNAIEAFEIMEELAESSSEVFLIVSDWIIPGIQAKEFLEMVNEKFPGFYKILLTNQTNYELVVSLKKKVNLNSVLYKPWTEEDLKKIFHNCHEINDAKNE